MNGTEPSDASREQGIEFGTLASKLDTHQYPATTDELIEAYGEETIGLPNGTQRLRDVFAPFVAEGDGSEGTYQSVTYDSAGEVRDAVYNLVDAEAIGRERYSDRDPPAIGETTEADDQSF